MEIEAELKAFKARLDPQIGAYFDKAIEEASKEDAFVTDALRYGKTLMLAGTMATWAPEERKRTSCSRHP